MQIYGGGRLIHQVATDDGLIEVVDEQHCRSLHFGTIAKQSSMRLDQPAHLELSYTQAMMGCLLLMPKPSRVLVIGLGGGSLVKFLLHHFPECDITVIEYRRDVIDIAQTYFEVPTDNPHLNIQLGDGYLYVKNCFYHSEAKYDLVLVDAYDQNGMAKTIGVQAFFDACAGILNDKGVMSINLWGSNRAEFVMTMNRINQSFADNSMILPVENKGNMIALATKYAVKQTELKGLRRVVDEMELHYQINLPKLLQYLIRQQRNFIHRFFSI